MQEQLQTMKTSKNSEKQKSAQKLMIKSNVTMQTQLIGKCNSLKYLQKYKRIAKVKKQNAISIKIND